MFRYHNFVENPITGEYTRIAHEYNHHENTYPSLKYARDISQPRNLNLQYAYDIQNQDEVLHKVQFTFLSNKR